MERVTQEDHRGCKIIIIDLSYLRAENVQGALQDIGYTLRQDAGEGLLLVDMTGTPMRLFNKAEGSGAAGVNGSAIQAVAVLGAQGSFYLLLKLVSAISNEKVKVFRTRSDAFDWLVSRR